MNDTRSGSQIELSDMHLGIEMQLPLIIRYYGNVHFE